MPFIRQSCIEYNGYTEEEGETIPPEISAVSWCDADYHNLVQLMIVCQVMRT